MKRRKKTENKPFRFLSVIGILLVVTGHLGWDSVSLSGLFPSYQFHVPLFLFISGYFYRPSHEDAPGPYLLRKAVKLLVPYFFWNLVYGLVAQALRSHTGLIFGEKVSFYTLVVRPFVDGHQFMYNLAAWFVPALFLAETAYMFLRRCLRGTVLQGEGLFLLLCLALGCVTVWAYNTWVLSYWLLPLGRTLFFLPCLQLGRMYRAHWEKLDTLSNGAYLFLVVAAQMGLLFLVKDTGISTLEMRFPGGALAAYAGIVLGIAFWLRICRILSPALSRNPLVLEIGRHTYDIMIHHLGAFFLLKLLFFGLWRMGWCPAFDAEAFATNFLYFYVPGGDWFLWAYAAAGVLLPLLLRRILNRWRLTRWL